MTGAWVNQASSSVASGTSKSQVVHATRTNGNLLIASCLIKNNDAITFTGAGWAQLGSTVHVGTTTTVILAYRIVDGTEPTIVFNWTNSSAARSLMAQYSGVNASSFGTIASNSGTGTTHSKTGFNTTAANSFVIYRDENSINNGVATPAGWTEDYDQGSAGANADSVAGHKLVVTSGSASGDISVTGGNADWVMWQIELLDAGSTQGLLRMFS